MRAKLLNKFRNFFDIFVNFNLLLAFGGVEHDYLNFISEFKKQFIKEEVLCKV